MSPLMKPSSLVVLPWPSLYEVTCCREGRPYALGKTHLPLGFRPGRTPHRLSALSLYSFFPLSQVENCELVSYLFYSVTNYLLVTFHDEVWPDLTFPTLQWKLKDPESPFSLESFCLLESLICFLTLFCSHNKTDTLYLYNNLFKSFYLYLLCMNRHSIIYNVYYMYI